MIEVLLVSPKDPKVPSDLKLLVGGENTYTNRLLDFPPENVRYTHHSEALKKGYIEYTFWQKTLSLILGLRILPPDAGYQCFRLKKKFDLIHCHAYSLKLDGEIKPPVVLGDSSCNYLYLSKYLHWPKIQIKISHFIRRQIHRFLDVYDPIWTREKAKFLVVMSDFAKKLHFELNKVGNIVVIPPGIPDHTKEIKTKYHKDLIQILFVGVWFERKGGLILIKAFRKLIKDIPKTALKLLLIGQLPRGVDLPAKTEHIEFVPYDVLLNKYIQSDIFVLVPPEVEGYGLAVEEAMSFGLPIVVSDVCALSERVVDGENGLVIKPGNVNDLTKALEFLVRNTTVRRKMGESSRKKYIKTFSIIPTGKKLAKLYLRSL